MTVRVKICGITRAEDAAAAVALGADAVGFVFWRRSPRYIEPPRARAIVAGLPPFVVPFGVFVDERPDGVARIVHEVRLRGVQLHGDERTEDFDALPVALVKAVAVAGTGAEAALALPPGVTALLDACDPIRRGGTGRTIDWTAAAAIARHRRVILSGGLTPDNVAQALTAVRPYAVDVSSGVEESPGRKDHERLRAFFAAVRACSDHHQVNPEPRT